VVLTTPPILSTGMRRGKTALAQDPAGETQAI
jgi:hypothetical protein